MSIVLKGHIEYGQKQEGPTKDDNICLASENGFDALWKTYASSEDIFDKYYKN